MDRDILDLSNIHADSLQFHEENGSTILELSSIDQIYILKDISLDELGRTDFISSNQEVVQILNTIFEPLANFDT